MTTNRSVTTKSQINLCTTGIGHLLLEMETNSYNIQLLHRILCWFQTKIESFGALTSTHLFIKLVNSIEIHL